MVRKLVAVLFAFALVGASVSAAQSIGASAVYASLGGNDFSDVDAGFGVEGNVMFPVAPSIKLGVSGQWTTHAITGETENLKVLGIFAEGRYLFTMAGKATPYLGARAGWAQWSFSQLGSTAKASGIPFGGGVGVMIGLSPGLAIDLNGMFHTVSFGTAKVDGTEIPDSKLKGTVLEIRAGVNFRVGGQ